MIPLFLPIGPGNFVRAFLIIGHFTIIPGMKKILSLLLVFFVLLPVFSENVDVILLKGPTAMGMAFLMDKAGEKSVDGYEYDFSIEASPDMAIPRIVRGDFTFASVPLNLASVLYNRTKGDVSAVAINTLGVLYIAGKDCTISSLKDLVGKTIYSAGKGATPEYVLCYLLKANGMEIGKDVFVEWKSEHTECVLALAEDDEAVALLPEPFLSAALEKDPALSLLVDLNEEWRLLTGKSVITGVTIANDEKLLKDENLLPSFLTAYGNSVERVNSEINEAAMIMERYGIISAAVGEKAIPGSHIVMISGDEMKDELSSYLEVLCSIDPKSIGGAVPGDDFYQI